jgi:hypothetical protein
MTEKVYHGFMHACVIEEVTYSSAVFKMLSWMHTAQLPLDTTTHAQPHQVIDEIHFFMQRLFLRQWQR